MSCPYQVIIHCRLHCSSFYNPSNKNRGDYTENGVDHERCDKDKYETCPFYGAVQKQHSASVQTARRVRVKCPGCGKEFIINIV